MIEPTVGRIVWFFHSSRPDEPTAAIICHVWHNRMVNLVLFEHDGVTRSATSVPLLQDDDKPLSSIWCAWMPYQLGQAARTEAAEAKNVG